MNIEYIKINPEKYGSTASIKELEKILSKASQSYYNDNIPIISDVVYDIIMDKLEERDKDNKFITKIGYKNISDKIKLPYFMGSMNKIKTKDGVLSWTTKYNKDSEFVISDKLDGISALYVDNRLYTRGNGEYGRDISNLLKYLKIQNIGKMVVRGELIISNDNFNKNRGIYTSPRSMVNGLIAMKEDNSLLNILDFVVFEIITPEIEPYKQLDYMKHLGIKVPNYKIVKYGDIIQWESDTNNYLTNTLYSYREKSLYTIDGIIITHNKLYPRVNGNPKNSIAFKSNNYGKVTIIKDIEWSASKYGLLIPRIKFEKIDLGSKVEYCTGFSGKYIFNNSLGPGSKIRVILSGDVIPYVVEIISKTYPKMPSVGYIWNSNKLHCKLIDEDSELSKKKLLHFIKTIKVDYLSVGLISKLYDNGYKSINDILDLSYDKLIKIDGFKDVLTNKIVDEIKLVKSKQIYLGLLMVGSLEFNSGFGIKKFRKILNKYPNLLETKPKLEDINNIEGFQTKTSKQFLDNLDNFKEFLLELDLDYYVKEDNEIIVIKNPNINGKHFVMTGFRDLNIISNIDKNGGIIQNDVNMKTDYLIVKDHQSNSSKFKRAKIMGVGILLKEDFYKILL